MRLIPWLSACFAALAISSSPQAAERAVPVVVELFTSQGCNSCPPADAYLTELAKRPDVLALSLHVDYWDYIGWKDPFAQHEFTLRQRAYSQSLAQRYVYTPQMVINGRLQGVGSERTEIEALIAAAMKAHRTAPSAIRYQRDQIRIDGGLPGPGIVWLALFDPSHWTEVPRGENAGRRLGDTNVVREWRQIGRYGGQPLIIAFDMDQMGDGKQGCAVLLQSGTPDKLGPILAASVVDSERRK